MSTWSRIGLFVGFAGMVLLVHTGCVRTSTYESTMRKLDDVWILYHNEQLQTQELRARNRQLKEQMAELAATLRVWRDQVARAERESKQAREELAQAKAERGMPQTGGAEETKVDSGRSSP
jgi:hypothetical protein